MSTPHNAALSGAIAKVVLMPGDPLRAKFIADTYLHDTTLFNTVRNMYGYTGIYDGKQISVMGSGMGMPSIGIYSYELFHYYDVDCIIRIGSAGAYSEELGIFDLVLADSAWSESTYALVQNGTKGDICYPSKALNDLLEQSAQQLGYTLHKGRIHSSDVFYHEANVDGYREFLHKHDCICVEMESYALFHNARVLGKEAACLLTISDSFVTHEETTAQERESSFHSMIKTAMTAAVQRS